MTCPICQSAAIQTVRKKRDDLELFFCPSCQLVFQKEVFNKDLYEESYYDHWTNKGEIESIWAMKVKTFESLLKTLGDQGGGRLLDIGCAHGFMLEAAKRMNFEAIGIEISPAAKTARERGFSVKEGEVRQAEFPDDYFEVITIIDVLEHIEDPVGFMKEVFRILMPKGKLLIVTPDVRSMAARILRGHWPHYKPEHLFYYSKKSISELLRRTGFEVHRVGKGHKYLQFEYILNHFIKFSRKWHAQLLKGFSSLIPKKLQHLNIRYWTEMVVVAHKP